LGWDQLLYQGWVTTEWATAINEIHPELPILGTQVMIQLQTIVWTYILDMCYIQKNHLCLNATQLILPNYWQAAMMLHEQHHQLPPAAQEALFWQPLDEIIELLAP